MMIPMIVLQVKQPDAGELKIELRGCKEAVEGEELELGIILSRPDDRKSPRISALTLRQATIAAWKI